LIGKLNLLVGKKVGVRKIDGKITSCGCTVFLFKITIKAND
jgi:hypothetical protein